MPGSSDPYTYPGTDVLRNILDIRDPQQLAAFEANATAARLIELDAAPLVGQFDVAHLKAIHRHIFQDVYPWAGEFRTVNISKGGHLFGAAAFAERTLEELLRKLSGECHLKGSHPGTLRLAQATTWERSTPSIRSGMETVARSASSSGNSARKPAS